MNLDMRIWLFWKFHAEWSQATFGRDQEKGPIGSLKHLQKEAKEAADTPEDISEYADCFILLCDATRRAGWTFEQLMEAVEAKMEVNRKRQWPKPTGKDTPIEHIK